jgi:threonine aldolase
MGVELCFFDPSHAWEFELRRKRVHLASKHRYLSAQMEAHLEGDLWHELAGMANIRPAFSQRLQIQCCDVPV